VSRTERPTDRRIDRWSGGCLVGAGLLLLPTAVHPNIFKISFAHAVHGTPLWTPMHASLVLATTLSLAGLMGLYVPRADRLGRLGAVGIVLSVPGSVIAACVFYWEAFLLPVLVRESPELVDLDGPVFASWGVRAGALAGLWFIGLVLLGLALWRAGEVPGPAALTLVISAVAFAALEGPFVPVLGPLSTVAVAGGYAWVGVALWTGATGRPSRAAAGRGRRSPPLSRAPARGKPS
jgi:hypothetical protein